MGLFNRKEKDVKERYYLVEATMIPIEDEFCNQHEKKISDIVVALSKGHAIDKFIERNNNVYKHTLLLSGKQYNLVVKKIDKVKIIK